MIAMPRLGPPPPSRHGVEYPALPPVQAPPRKARSSGWRRTAVPLRGAIHQRDWRSVRHRSTLSYRFGKQSPRRCPRQYRAPERGRSRRTPGPAHTAAWRPFGNPDRANGGLGPIALANAGATEDSGQAQPTTSHPSSAVSGPSKCAAYRGHVTRIHNGRYAQERSTDACNFNTPHTSQGAHTAVRPSRRNISQKCQRNVQVEPAGAGWKIRLVPSRRRPRSTKSPIRARPRESDPRQWALRIAAPDPMESESTCPGLPR